jgi:hypothetical protein
MIGGRSILEIAQRSCTSEFSEDLKSRLGEEAGQRAALCDESAPDSPEDNEKKMDLPLLHFFARKNDPGAVKLMVDFKADLCLHDLLGREAWQVAAQSGHVQVLKVLVEAGCKPKPPNIHEKILWQASNDKVVQFAISAKADVNLQNPDSGLPPLLSAVKLQRHKLVVALLEAGADPRVSGDAGETVATLAQWEKLSVEQRLFYAEKLFAEQPLSPFAVEDTPAGIHSHVSSSSGLEADSESHSHLKAAQPGNTQNNSPAKVVFSAAVTPASGGLLARFRRQSVEGILSSESKAGKLNVVGSQEEGSLQKRSFNISAMMGGSKVKDSDRVKDPRPPESLSARNPAPPEESHPAKLEVLPPSHTFFSN